MISLGRNSAFHCTFFSSWKLGESKFRFDTQLVNFKSYVRLQIFVKSKAVAGGSDESQASMCPVGFPIEPHGCCVLIDS